MDVFKGTMPERKRAGRVTDITDIDRFIEMCFIRRYGTSEQRVV